MPPAASIIVPTRARPDYLEVTLASVAPQASALGAEVIVVDDGGLDANRAVAEAHGARYLAHDVAARPERRAQHRHRGGGVRPDRARRRRRRGAAPAGSRALLEAAARDEREVRRRADPGAPRRHDAAGTCGREGPPITFLDLGPRDVDAEFVWSANMAIRRAALERGRPVRRGARDLRRRGGVAAPPQGRRRAHPLRRRRRPRPPPRTPPDATPRALARAAYARGRNAAATTSARAPPRRSPAELRTLAGCACHGPLRRCANGAAAHRGRVWAARREALRARPGSAPCLRSPDRTSRFLSGTRGGAGGRTAVARRARSTALPLAALRARSGCAARAGALARRGGGVLVLGVERPDVAEPDGARARRARALAPRRRGPHRRRRRARQVREPQRAARRAPALEDRDWLLLVDDDVALPRGFLDRLLFLAERFDLDLAQPAHRHRSHAAWERHAAPAGQRSCA